MRRLTIALAFLATLGGGVGMAQPPGFGRPANPPISPYLSLFDRNNSTAFNYFQLVRPQREFRQAYRDLNRDVYQAERSTSRQAAQIKERLADVEARVRPGATLGTTGHKTSFLNSGSYFPSR